MWNKLTTVVIFEDVTYAHACSMTVPHSSAVRYVSLFLS